MKKKALMLNGSVNRDGNTQVALEEIAAELKSFRIESEIFSIGVKEIRDCIGCNKCTEKGCFFEDDFCIAFIAKAKEANGFIFESPVYYAHPSGRILSLLDRAFYSSASAFRYKPVASIAVARRAGTSTTFDVLNKYATISNRFIVGSSYWNNVFGCKRGEARRDEEGLQTRRNLAFNRSYILKCREAGKKEGVSLPKTEHAHHLNFIH